MWERRSGVRLLGAIGLSALLAGCPDTDAAVFVEARIEAANASVQVSPLSTGLGGSFLLSFHLGPRASDAAEVTLRQISVTNSDRTVTIEPSLAVTTSPAFPITVGIDSDASVGVSFAHGDNLLDPSMTDALCAPSGIVISCTFHDALLDGTSTVASSPFAVTGCP